MNSLVKEDTPASPPPLGITRPRPSSLPSAPRRPPPRPSFFRFSTAITHEVCSAGWEVIADLQSDLDEVSSDIQKCQQKCSDLGNFLQVYRPDEDQSRVRLNLAAVVRELADLQENKKRLEENLLSLSSNEAKLEKARLLATQQATDRDREEEDRRKVEEDKRKMEERRMEEARARNVTQRDKVIEEIINTERDYLDCLKLTLDTFYDEQNPPTSLNLRFLLGNMEEIADVSQKLLKSLETSVNGKSPERQCLGHCFINLADDMKETYAPYCRNHDEVIAALDEYKDSKEINDYFSSKLEKMKQHINVFDLPSLLIRPVQRILKYPLLLLELRKSTEADHPDQADLISAIQVMKDVARAINEYKRRKDLVYKYKKLTDETFSDKISKLNLHSIKKKSTRMRGRLSNNLGLALTLKDELFEKEEAKFHSLKKIVAVFMADVQQYLDQCQETVRCQNLYVDDVRDFYSGKDNREAATLYQVTNKQLSLFDSMKVTIESTVLEPLNKLLGLFDAPTKVIEKRFDKLLDYNSHIGKADNDKELQEARYNYEAMNDQLLDELPKFYTLSLGMLRYCMASFILARRDYMDQSLRESCVLLELSSMSNKGSLLDTFRVRHTSTFDQLSMLSFIPRGFNPRVDTMKADRVVQRGHLSPEGISQPGSPLVSQSTQNETQRRYLQQLYPPDRLLQAASTYNPVDLMDISLSAGSLVGLVKESDPMGNMDRWFVDDGKSKGFVPCHILKPVENIGSPGMGDEEDDIISILSDTSIDLILTGNDNRPEGLVNSTFTDSFSEQPLQSQLPQYYYALYDFKARNNSEVSLTAGHPVAVLAFHDRQGNTEWFLVDSDGNRGYTPATYLAPAPY